MTIGRSRSVLYRTAKYLGDYQALRTGDPSRIARRAERRILGRIAGRILGRITR